MKYISWNVNGIRACLNKGFLDFVQSEKPDAICLQETKAEREQVELALDGYHQYWNSASKKGYSGTAIFTKNKPLNVTYDMGIAEHDEEGRVIALEFPTHFLITVYTPNAKRGLERLYYRQQWDHDFLSYLKALEQTKPVVFCGDLNVAHKEIDLAHPQSNRRNAGFTDEERAGFDNIVQHGFIDTFREFNSEPHQYTWWSYMFNARSKNIGWRIDYFCVSQVLKKQLVDAQIHAETIGSDHCPVSVLLK